MGIGVKGMVVAAKVLVLTAVDLFLQPELVGAAREADQPGCSSVAASWPLPPPYQRGEGGG